MAKKAKPIIIKVKSLRTHRHLLTLNDEENEIAV